MNLIAWTSTTSQAVDEAIAVLREQLKDARNDLKTAMGVEEKAAHEERVLNMLDRLATVENNRAAIIVGLMAGRRGVDKLPEGELEQIQKEVAALSAMGEEKGE